MNIKAFILPILFVLLNSTVNSQIYYVDITRPDNSGDGLTWLTAKKNIQDAINISTAGAQIWVRSGTYYPDEGTGLTNDDRLSTFLLKSGVRLYGSFAGTESSLGERIIDVNALTTILSGEIQQDSDTTNNVFHVVTSMDAGPGSILDGVKVTLGYANDGTTYENQRGAGMLIEANSTTSNILQTTFCAFTHNYALSQGGAVFMEANEGENINCFFGNSIFNYNEAGFDGGGIFAGAYVGTNISSMHSCGFLGNHANSGGAMHIFANDNGNVSLQLTFIVFDLNTANTDAGAVSNYVASGVSNTSMLFCQFLNNYSGGNGGAVFCIAQAGTNNLSISKSNFIGNSTINTHSGGAIYFLTDSGASISNTKINKCLFKLNSSGFGGAVAHSALEGVITSYIYQSVLIKNTADFSGAVDSYIENGTGNVFLVNSTITENTSNLGAATETFIAATGDSYFNLLNSISSNNTGIEGDVYFSTTNDQINFSMIQNEDCTSIDPGICNNSIFGEDPLFVNPALENYKLQSCSPAINNGTIVGFPITLDTTDRDENPRFVDTLDMGPYEFTTSIVVTWLGGVSDDWGTAGNWDTNTVPTMCNDVIVNFEPNLPKVNGVYACRKLFTNTNATLEVETGLLTVKGY